MDAKAKTVNEILYASNQYLVPFFQRQYSWTQKHWRRLWDDLAALLEDRGTSQHFLGPMVCTSYRNVPGEVPAHLLIDGQQRMTTLTVLLAALRDVSEQRGRHELAEEITESFLTHKHKTDLQRYKVIPRIVDRDALIAIVEGHSDATDKKSRATPAMRFFRKRIEQHAADGGDRALRLILTAVTDRLSLVVITIDGENPYEIFESLNSTGLPLEESDLIRNFIFMQVPTDEQEEFWDKHWGPLEEQFGKEGEERAAALTQFYRSYLMREGQYSKKRATFVDFKAQSGSRKLSPQEVAAELRRFAKYELWLRRPATCGQAGLRKRLAQVALLDITTGHPLLMHVLDRHERGELAEQTLLGCIDDLCSFALRRSICGETTRTYGRWFPEAIREIKDEPREDLRKYYLRRGWPDDEAFTEWLVEFPVYRREFRKARLMLESLEESHDHKEPVDPANLTIEHVMPQTLSGKHGQAWKQMLGEDCQRVHEHMLHTLGNLTLTGYNAPLGNQAYAQKRAQLRESHVELNKYFAAVEAWDEEAIRRRGGELAGKVAEIWSRPEGVAYIAPKQKRWRMSADRRQEYWQGLLDSREWGDEWRLPTASRGGNLRFRLGVRHFRLVAYMWRGERVGVGVSCRGPNAEVNWNKFREQQADLERESGFPLTWETDSRGARFIASERSADLRSRDDWPKQHAWLAQTMDAMRKAFLPRLRELGGTDSNGDLGKLRLEYWTQLRELLLQRNGPIRPRKASGQHWMDFRIGRSAFGLFASMNTRDSWIRVGLGCYGKNAEEQLQLLQSEKDAIEGEIGTSLQWESLPGRKESRVTLHLRDALPPNRDDWPRQHSWLIKMLEGFHAAFASRVKALPGGSGTSDRGTTRDYWQARKRGAHLSICDRVLGLINEKANPPQELKYLKHYIGLRRSDGVPSRNFVHFGPHKAFVRIWVYLSHPAEWAERLKAAGLPAQAKKKNLLYTTVRPEDFDQHVGLVRELVHQAVDEYMSGDSPSIESETS